MKKLITLILMITIQITFMQKVIASVSLLESGSTSISHCEMLMAEMSEADCLMTMSQINTMENCKADCKMMNVLSVTHFIEYSLQFSFPYTQFNYPTLKLSTTDAQPASLYRPPLLS